MNDQELQQLWQNSAAQLPANANLINEQARQISQSDAKRHLNSMRPTKIIAVLLGIIWVIGVGGLLLYLSIFAAAQTSLYFLISMSIQVLLTAVAVGAYLYQLALIQTLDLSGPIVTIQEKLHQLKASTLWATRLLVLQLPVWTTFFWSNRLFEQGITFPLALNIALTVLFTGVAVWLFFNIRYENRDQKWFKILFSGKEWEPLMHTFRVLEEARDYQKE
jgi:hypothetical protein